MKTLLVLGPGCPRCQMLAVRVEEAAKKLGMDYELDKVTNLTMIQAFGVMVTPGLVVDGNVVLSGKVPSVDELMKLLQE